MNAPLVSVIIPVFNAEPYLEQCILSVLAQTLQDIEVIAVNDGSTDDSGAILDRIAAADGRLRVFHRTNHGVSSARNFGLNNARGAFIGFVDADDWIEPEMLGQMYETVMHTQSDWVVCNVSIHEADGTTRNRLPFEDQTIDVPTCRPELLRRFMRFNFDYANWNKLYKAEIIHQNKIRFDETMFLWEDLLFNLTYLLWSEKAVLIDKAFYHYRVQPASITHQGKDSLIRQYNKLYERYMLMLSGAESYQMREMFRTEIARGCYNHMLYSLAKESYDSTSGFWSFVKNYYHKILQIEPAIFYYPDACYKGIQPFKKALLSGGWILLFSFIAGVSYYIKYFKKK